MKTKTQKSILIKFALIFSATFAFTFVSFAVDNKPTLSSEDMTMTVVEQMPEFPGGMNALMRFLSHNIRYPVEAQEKGIQGRVVVQFTVEKTGKISNIEVVQSVSPALDNEAVRLIELMPDWIPAEQRGEKIDMRYTMPINFRLQEKDTKRNRRRR